MSRANKTHLIRGTRGRVILLALCVALLVIAFVFIYRMDSPSPTTIHTNDQTDVQMAAKEATPTISSFLPIIGYKLEAATPTDCSYGDPTIVPYSCRISAFITPNPSEPSSTEPDFVAKKLRSFDTALTNHGWKLTNHYNDALGKLQSADWPSTLAERAIAVTYSKTYSGHSTTTDLRCEVEIVINISPQPTPIGYNQDTLTCNAQSNS